MRWTPQEIERYRKEEEKRPRLELPLPQPPPPARKNDREPTERGLVIVIDMF